MIRLHAHPCPLELTPAVQASLTAEFLADNSKSVWNKSYIRRELLLMSHGKCCYCECKIDEESKYLEVEHFQAKSLYPLLAVIWLNLLPACKRCNGAKGNYDIVFFPIIHPVNDNPKEHLAYSGGWLKEKTPLGAKTIEVVDLNDLSRNKLVEKRNEIGEQIQRELDRLEDSALDFQNGVDTSERRKIKIVHWMKGILNDALPQREYAATAATVLLNEPLFEKVKSILQACLLWDNEMTSMESTARQIALDIF